MLGFDPNLGSLFLPQKMKRKVAQTRRFRDEKL
jgi:hypothetical protein